MTLIRSPMLSQVDRVVAARRRELQHRARRAAALSAAAAVGQAGPTACVLMVELGDLREGILPDDLARRRRARCIAPARPRACAGIGTNLACQSGVVPDAANMAELSAPGRSPSRRRSGSTARASCRAATRPTSTGPSAATDVGRVNDLRLGESILLGRETARTADPIDGLHTDAITLVAEVIESKVKPSLPWGDIAQTAFGETVAVRSTGAIAARRSSPSVARTSIPTGLDAARRASRSSAPAATTSCSTPGRLDRGRRVARSASGSTTRRSSRAMTSPFVAERVLATQTCS